jgi:plasmid stabilization system protein ParE
MTAQEDFSQLTDRINQAKVEAAARQSRDELQAEVEQGQKTSIAGTRQRSHAAWDVLVSFGYVRSRSAHTTQGGSRGHGRS